jgi:hypothetical protein
MEGRGENALETYYIAVRQKKEEGREKPYPINFLSSNPKLDTKSNEDDDFVFYNAHRVPLSAVVGVYRG